VPEEEIVAAGAAEEPEVDADEDQDEDEDLEVAENDPPDSDVGQPVEPDRQ
jgi:hypothetical protein